MSTSRDEFFRATQSVLRAFSTVFIPSLSEARVAWLLSDVVNNLVLGAEGAVCDLGLIVTKDEAEMSADSTKRLYQALRKFQGQNVVLGMDVKMTTPSSIAWDGDLWATFKVDVTQSQAIYAEFLIIISPAVPDLLALVPRSFVQRQPGGSVTIPHREFPAYDGQEEPFPMMISPFVMPASALPSAVRAVLEFYDHPENGLFLPYNNIVINGIQRPQLSHIDCLRPSTHNKRTDLSDQMWIWSAFERHSRDWSVQRLTIEPGVGDFQLVKRETDGRDIRLVIELKRGRVRRNSGGGFQHDQYHWRASSRYFSTSSSADYMLSLFSSLDEALFFPFDAVPGDWFTTDQPSMPWTTAHEAITMAHFTLGSLDTRGQNLVRGIEGVLQRREASGKGMHSGHLENYGHKIPTPRDIAALSSDSTLQDVKERDSAPNLTADAARVEADRPDGPSTNIDDAYEPDREKPSRSRFELKVERYLKQECDRRTCGRIYRLDLHPTATHVYVPLRHEAGSPCFLELHPDTPVLYLNFAAVDTADEVHPRCHRQKPYFAAKHGVGSSIYILFPSLHFSMTGKGLNCYVVPSTLMEIEGDLTESNRGFGGKEIHLVNEQPLSAYSHNENTVVSFLDHMLRQWSGTNRTEDGSFQEQGLYDPSSINAAVGFKSELVRRALEMECGQTLWREQVFPKTVPGWTVESLD